MHRRISCKATVASLGLIAVSLPLSQAGASVILNGETSYTQNFDSLTTDVITTDGIPWVDNSTLPGWYAGYTSGSALIRSSAGGVSTASLYSYGSTTSVNGGADRALGSIPNDTIGSIRYAVAFVNNTDVAITGFTLTYDGEQWRVATNTLDRNNQIVPAYQVFATGGDLISGTWTNLDNAEFNSPLDNAGASAGLDGNLPANRVAGLTDTASVVVQPGEMLWVRFFDGNSTNVDQGMAIDNVSITFTYAPEPASLALLGSAGLLVLGRSRRVRVRL